MNRGHQDQGQAPRAAGMLRRVYSQFGGVLALVALGAGIGSSDVMGADYKLELQSQGTASRQVRVGESFALEVVATAETSVTQIAAALRVDFSFPGLRLNSVQWSAPYVTGDLDDASTPAASGLPVVITASTLIGEGHPAQGADIYLSNLIQTSARFGSGTLVRLGLTVPTGYFGPEEITISVLPDGFSDGLRELTATTGGTPFRLRIVPEAGVATPLLLIQRQDDVITVSWPSSLSGGVLETSPAVDAIDGWRPVTVPSVLRNDRTFIELPFSSFGGQFFRLRLR